MNTGWGRDALRSKAVWFSLLIILGMGAVAVLAPWIAPHDPYRMGITQSNLPPVWVQDVLVPGRSDYPLGSDFYGRDVLSRLIYGTRTAFCLALAAVPLAALIGTLAGLAAGMGGSKIDRVIIFLTDAVQSLPGIMFMVIIVLIFRNWFSPTWGEGLLTLVIGFAAFSWAGLARLVRVSVLQIKTKHFIEAATGMGASPWYVAFRHLLPNVFHLVMVWMINQVPAVILLEAILGYIGVGVTRSVDGGEFTVVSWGGMFFSGRSAMNRNPFMLFVPSLCLLLISMSFILLGDYLIERTHRQPE